MSTHVSQGPFVSVPGIFHNAEQACDIHVEVFVEGNQIVILREADKTELARWPLDEVRLAGGSIPLHGLRLARGKSDLARLTIHDLPFISALQKRAPHLVEERIFDMRRLRLVGALVLVLIGIVVSVFFILVPLSAKQLARLTPEPWRVQLGEATQNAIIAEVARRAGRKPEDIICTGEVGRRALDKMVAKVAPHVSFDSSLKIIVVDDEFVNAFAMPGGHIIIFKGLLNFARNGDEVAGVLAHELGHLEARDPSRSLYERGSTPVLMKLLFGDFGGGDLALSLGQLLVSAKHSRGKEADADGVALRSMTAAGINPEALAVFLDRVARATGNSPKVFRWMMSHPAPEERAAAVRAGIDNSRRYEPVISQSDFLRLRMICSNRERRFDDRLPVKNRGG